MGRCVDASKSQGRRKLIDNDDTTTAVDGYTPTKRVTMDDGFKARVLAAMRSGKERFRGPARVDTSAPTSIPARFSTGGGNGLRSSASLCTES